MEVLAKCRKPQLCPCYKKCQEFQKLVELKDYGLVIYCHRRSTENIRQDEAVDSAENTSSDVFILHIKKDGKLTTSQVTSKLGKENISCPRCRKKIEHAQELIKEVKSLNRRNVMGICDHCRKKALDSENPFCVCEKIVKLFKTVKGEQTEDTKRYAYTDLQINRDIKPPAAGHKPDVQQMFYRGTRFQSDDTEMSETDSKEAVNYILKPIVPTPHADEKISTTNSGISLVGSVTSIDELFGGVKKLPRPSNKDRKQEEILEDIPSMNAKEELKRRHDLSLRRMVNFEKDSGVPVSISKRPDVYETPKNAAGKQKHPTEKQKETKYHGSEMEIKKIQTKHELGSSSLVGKVKKPEQRVKKSKSEPVASVGSVVKPQFSNVLPKVKEKKGKQISVKSSELIKDSYDKNTKRKEQKRQQGQKKQRDKSKESLLRKEVLRATKKLKSSDDIKTSTSNKDESSEEDKVKEVSIKKKKEGEIKESPKNPKEIEEFKRLQAEYLKSKLVQKKQLDEKRVEQKQKQEAKSEINMKKIRVKQSRRSDEFLKLAKIKQTKKISPFDITNELLKAHTAHRKRGQKLATCPICLDSELELDVLSINCERTLKKDKINNIIVGEKIYRYKQTKGSEKTKKPEGVDPIIFQKDVVLESDFQDNVQIIPQEAEAVQKKTLVNEVLKVDELDTEANAGIIRYALSDRKFIDRGWTVLPTEKILRMMNVYRMRPARPEFDWFKHNKNKRLMSYDTGERLAEFDDNGRGRWYYRNGRLALDYYDAEETNAQQRFVIYSSGEPDERGRTHPITILATFDYLGNGIVFDHAGKIRLKYNQTEGVVLDRSIGPVSHWKWHTLNDPPVLQQVMIDTQVAHKDPDILKLGSQADDKTRPANEEMLAIEFDNFIKEKSKKLSQTFKPFQIKMKALKINEHFSLKVLDQATVYLIFRDGITNLKINMGMILDEKEIVDTNAAEMGEVSNSLERFPARSDSLAGLQRSVAHARRYERQHAERELRLRPQEPCASTDLMLAAASKPMRLPFRTVSTGSVSTTPYCSRKPSNNLYYDTRLLC